MPTEAKSGRCLFIGPGSPGAHASPPADALHCSLGLRDNLIALRSPGIKTIYFDDEKQDFELLLTTLQEHGVIVPS
ncbi:Uncharacterised protein [Xylophilus ampelinus]|nr:hypothetical protein [Variovorax sp.]VTY38979.1 Uncharacterised protein [Xylophilus ampelinus]